MAEVFAEDARLRVPTVGIGAEVIEVRELLEGALLVAADGAMFQAMTVTTRAGGVSVKLMGGPGGAVKQVTIEGLNRLMQGGSFVKGLFLAETMAQGAGGHPLSVEAPVKDSAFQRVRYTSEVTGAEPVEATLDEAVDRGLAIKPARIRSRDGHKN